MCYCTLRLYATHSVQDVFKQVFASLYCWPCKQHSRVTCCVYSRWQENYILAVATLLILVYKQLFYPADGCTTFLRNTGNFLPNYTALHLRSRWNFQFKIINNSTPCKITGNRNVIPRVLNPCAIWSECTHAKTLATSHKASTEGSLRLLRAGLGAVEKRNISACIE